MSSIIDTTKFHHLPGTAAQYLVTMHQLLPDTPAHRNDVANTFGLVGKKRDIFVDFGIFVGDNQNSTAATMDAYYGIISRQSRISFPDTVITKDNFMGDGKGALVNYFTSGKNTFPTEAGVDATEMPTEHKELIKNFTGEDLFNADYGMAVLGHEMHHSMDLYVRTCANEDLQRRWGQMLVYGGGPDIRADASGWYSQSLTQAHWQTAGHWDGTEDWTTAWDRYWTTGPGAAFNKLTSYKNEANFRLVTSQESLSGLANFAFDYAEGNLLLGVDRFRRAEAGGSSLAPLKATINDAVHFIDFRSTGQNKVIMYDTSVTAGATDWSGSTYAYLERDDKGYITKITIEDRVYEFTYDSTGIVTGITNAPQVAKDDVATTGNGEAVSITPLSNDIDLRGNNPISINSYTQPTNGSVTRSGNSFTYTPNANYTGTDSFTYTTDITNGKAVATIRISVGLPNHLWTFNEGSGTTVSDSSGLANGTLVNMDANDWVTGKVGSYALDFDGSNDKVTFGTRPSLSGQTDFTISAWIKTTSTAIGTIIQQRDSGIDGQYWLRTNANGTVNFALYGQSAFQFNFSTTATVNDGSWHHITMQRDGADGRIYIDGTQAASATGTIRDLSGSIGVALGADIRDNNAYFNGSIDEVGIYKRTLTTSEITVLAGGSGGSNNAPVANNDSATTNQNSAVTINNVLSNDTDADGNTLSVTGNSNPSNGSVTRNGNSFTYTPNNGYTGSDAFNYTISDGNGGTATGTVNITVNSTTGGGTSQTFTSSTPVTIPVGGSTATVTSNLVVAGMSGTMSDVNVTVNISHSYNDDLAVFLVAPDGTRVELFSGVGGGSDNFTNTVLDDQAGTAITSGSAPFTGTFSPEGSLATLNGKAPNGTWKLEITDNYLSADGGTLNSWSLAITTGSGGSSNAAPVANNDTATTNQDTAVVISNVLANDSDADGDTLSVTGNGNASNGTVVRNGNSFTYTPNAGYTGSDSFTYTISDGNGGTSTATVNVTVNGTSGGSTQTFSNTTDVVISENGTPTVTSDIAVSGMTGTVSDINVKFNIDHTYLSDLDVTLIAPDGTRFVLFTDVGGSSDNFVNTVIDDQATTAIGVSGTSAPFTGSFKPESGLLSSLNGKIANGTWQLEIKDDANSDGGTLKDWEIIITTA